MKKFTLSQGIEAYLNCYKNKKTGFRTGFDNFDQLFNGIYKGGLMVLGGRLNHGKTTTLINFALKASFEYNKKVLFISTKNKIENCIARYFAPILNISLVELTKLSLDNEKLTIFNQTISASNNIVFIESINKIPSDLFQEIQSINSESKFDAIFLDDIDVDDIRTEAEYWQEISKESGRTQILSYLSSLALELNIPIIVTTTLKQKLEKRGGDRKPQLKDFVEVESVEKYAHFIGGVYRPILYLITVNELGEDITNQLEINLLKNLAGPCFSIFFEFNSELLGLKAYQN